ncbi:MAG: MFS transporter, partial [Chloroflexi bacterium]|nr:MFS transporter [Chloroflexota bacterium]
MSSRVRSILRRRPSAFQLLASGNYRNYWINRGFSDLGLGFWFLGAAWLTLDLTDSQAWVGLVGGIAAIPAIAVSLFGGALSDRSDRRTIITRTQLALMLIAASIAALVLVDGIEPWHLVVGALAIGLADGLGAPAYGAFVVDLVGRDRVFAANSMAQFANFSGEIVGPLIVGALIATIGIGSVFVTALASSAIALLFILRVAARPALPAVAADRTGVFADIQAGVIYTWRTPGLTPLIAIAASGLFSAAVLPLIPVYARDVLGVGGSGFGVLMAALGGGFIAGSLLGAISGGVSHRGLVLL